MIALYKIPSITTYFYDFSSNESSLPYTEYIIVQMNGFQSTHLLGRLLYTLKKPALCMIDVDAPVSVTTFNVLSQT
jgi:hypothetical protein